MARSPVSSPMVYSTLRQTRCPRQPGAMHTPPRPLRPLRPLRRPLGATPPHRRCLYEHPQGPPEHLAIRCAQVLGLPGGQGRGRGHMARPGAGEVPGTGGRATGPRRRPQRGQHRQERRPVLLGTPVLWPEGTQLRSQPGEAAEAGVHRHQEEEAGLAGAERPYQQAPFQGGLDTEGHHHPPGVIDPPGQEGCSQVAGDRGERRQAEGAVETDRRPGGTGHPANRARAYIGPPYGGYYCTWVTVSGHQFYRGGSRGAEISAIK